MYPCKIQQMHFSCSALFFILIILEPSHIKTKERGGRKWWVIWWWIHLINICDYFVTFWIFLMYCWTRTVLLAYNSFRHRPQISKKLGLWSLKWRNNKNVGTSIHLDNIVHKYFLIKSKMLPHLKSNLFFLHYSSEFVVQLPSLCVADLSPFNCFFIVYS